MFYSEHRPYRHDDTKKILFVNHKGQTLVRADNLLPNHSPYDFLKKETTQQFIDLCTLYCKGDTSRLFLQVFPDVGGEFPVGNYLCPLLLQKYLEDKKDDSLRIWLHYEVGKFAAASKRHLT